MKTTILPLTLLITFACTLFWCGQSAGATGALAVTATVLTKSNCRFNTTAATLAFGNLDPANPVNVTATAILVYRCGGSAPLATFLITDDDGLYETGPEANRMQHGTIAGNYLPYQLTYSPASATVPRNSNQNLAVTATILGTGYQSAIAGNYSDTVVLSINP